MKCQTCKGTGKVYSATKGATICPKCHNKGFVKKGKK